MTNSTLSPQIVNDHVRKQITELLQKRGIYELGSYGWSGPDDYDDDTIGHAMWQTDSLYFHFLEAHFSATHAHGSAPKALESWQQFLVKSGGDFGGLVEAARLSIGLTLFQQRATDRDHYGESSFFQVHLMSSMVLLSAASDRLRDLFIAAVFQVNTDQYEGVRKDADTLKKKKESKASWYSGPFYEATRFPVATTYSTESFTALPALADRIFERRKVRNEIVHVVATELGRQRREFACRKKPDVVDENYSYEDIQAYQKQADTEYQARVSGDVERLTSWYELLIDMSNEVFIIENTLRRHSFLWPRCTSR